MYLTQLDYILLAIFAFLLVLLYVLIRINSADTQIKKREQTILELYYNKINKIPAMVEVMKKYTPYDDVFLELIRLHKTAMVSSAENIYDILESNHRIYREYQFLMRVSSRIKDLHKDGTFLYIRDFIMFYENQLSKEIDKINRDIALYNRYLTKKNLTIIGLIFPFHERLPIVL